MDEDEIPTAPVWVWIGLTVIACISFWTQATVTEERFVPALNVIANEYNIPDDIAGATLMAAGASSPELFSSIVALFITHSALGLGTIVGSEIFNQLIICAGAVFAARSGKLVLDKAIVIREVGFYALGIFLLYMALRDRRPADDDSLGDEHIYISFLDACLVFAGYIAYVIVCANMDAIVDFCSKTTSGSSSSLTGDGAPSYGTLNDPESRSSKLSIRLPNEPFLREAFTDEPVANFAEKATYFRTPHGLDKSQTSVRESWHKFSDGNSLRQFAYIVRSEKPSDEHDLYNVEFNSFEDRISCFMWQRSAFYNKAYFAKNGWHLRWFSFSPDKIRSIPDRAHSEKHMMKYPKFGKIQVDENRLIIRVPNSHGKKRPFFYWMAPSEEVFLTVVEKLEKVMKKWEEQAESLEMTPEEEEEDMESPDPHVDLTEWPSDGSLFDYFIFFFLYPIRLLMQLTIKDVRVLDQGGEPTATKAGAFLAIFSCLVWLIIGSYAMVASLESLAALMDIPDAVVGVTVSAAGTSLPNYVASKVAAQKGFGNMAVSNAFGSNTFNIMVGLGLPWVLYTASTGFQPYHGLRDDGITMSVILLGTVLLLFVVLVFPTNFTLYKWHGYLFIILYIAYLAYAIGTVYI